MGEAASRTCRLRAACGFVGVWSKVQLCLAS